MLVLELVQLPELRGPQIWKGKCPRWASFLAPDAAQSLIALEKDTGGLIFTDIYRPPDISLNAMKTKQGVQPPGFSGHNFGLSMDLTVDEILQSKKWGYQKLLEVMEAHRWYCHRRDGAAGVGKSEYWHFNYLPNAALRLNLADPKKSSTWAAPVEAEIKDRYGKQFELTLIQTQEALRKLRLYSGEVDGEMGPITKRSIEQFQRSWGLSVDGLLGPRTLRTLAVVTAEKRVLSDPTP